MKKILNKEITKNILNYRHIVYLLFSGLVLSSLSSCVVYYKTDDLRNTIDKTITQANNNYTEANRDYQEKKRIYFGLKNNIVDPAISPFNSITKQNSVLQNDINSLKTINNELVNNKNSFETLVQGKSKISSNEKEWKEFKIIKSNLESGVKEFQEQGEKYSASSNEFVNQINNSKFAQISPKDFDKQIKSNITSLNASLLEVTNKLKKAVVDIEHIHDINGISDSVYLSKKEILLEMDSKTKDIRSKSKLMNKLHKNFKRKTLGKKKLWVGENTKSNELINKIKKNANEISRLRNEFMALSNKLNAP